MKKSTKLIVALLVVVAALAVTYRLMNRVPSADLEANAQMQQIITDAGCLRCHTSNPDLPFYAGMPVAVKIVMEDVSKAYRVFDMTQMAQDLEAGNQVDQVTLAKVEKVILDGKMPQAKYYLVHWGASISDAKKELALNWVKNHRMGLMTDTNVAPEFVNEPIRPIADSISCARWYWVICFIMTLVYLPTIRCLVLLVMVWIQVVWIISSIRKEWVDSLVE